MAGCGWAGYEIFETSRRLALSGIVALTTPGSLSQIVFGFAVSVFCGLVRCDV